MVYRKPALTAEAVERIERVVAIQDDMRRLVEYRARAVVAAVLAGASLRDIAKRLDVTHQTVSNWAAAVDGVPVGAIP